MFLKRISRQPQTFLNVTKVTGTAGALDSSNAVYVNILDIDVVAESYGIRTSGNIPGMCPPYQEHAARRAAGYKIPEWRELSHVHRAIELAMFRIDNKVEAIASEAMKEKNI